MKLRDSQASLLTLISPSPFFGLVWRLLDRISGPARIIILESVFVGASTGTDICTSSIHPVFSCYLFITEYAEAAIFFFWRRPRRCPFSASFTPSPPFSISTVLFLPSLRYLTIRVSFFQLKPTPTDIPSVPPFLSALLSPRPSLISSVLSLISIKKELELVLLLLFSFSQVELYGWFRNIPNANTVHNSNTVIWASFALKQLIQNSGRLYAEIHDWSVMEYCWNC